MMAIDPWPGLLAECEEVLTSADADAKDWQPEADPPRPPAPHIVDGSIVHGFEKSWIRWLRRHTWVMTPGRPSSIDWTRICATIEQQCLEPMNVRSGVATSADMASSEG